MSGRRRTLFEDANFVLDRMEHDVGVQAIPETVTEGVQATAGAPKHGATQYEPLEMVPEEVKSHLSDGALGDFLKRVDGLMEAGGSSIQFTSHKPTTSLFQASIHHLAKTHRVCVYMLMHVSEAPLPSSRAANKTNQFTFI